MRGPSRCRKEENRGDGISAIMIVSAESRDRSFRLVDRGLTESRRRTGWLRDILGAAAEPGGIPPGRSRLEPTRSPAD